MEKAVSTQRGSICLRDNAMTTIFVLVPKELMVVHLKIQQLKTVCTFTLNVTLYISATHGMVVTSYSKPSCFHKMPLPKDGVMLEFNLFLSFSFFCCECIDAQKICHCVELIFSFLLYMLRKIVILLNYAPVKNESYYVPSPNDIITMT